MVDAIFILGIALGFYILWKTSQVDLLRIVKGSRRARGTVVRHLFQDGDGYVPVYGFSDGASRHEVRGFFASITPRPAIGAPVMLIYPAGHPLLARPPQPFQKAMFYSASFAWIALFYELLTGNLL